MILETFNRNKLRKFLKKILKQDNNYFKKNNIIYIYKNPNKKTNIYTSIDVIEEFLQNKLIDIIDLLDSNSIEAVYNELEKKIFNEENNNHKEKYYIILSNKPFIEFKKNLILYAKNNKNLNAYQLYELNKKLNKIKLIIQ